MKRLNFIGLITLLVFASPITSIYTFWVPKLEGGSQPLSAYQGKKILVITLPVQQNASTDSMLYSLDTLGNAHLDSLAIIGVPAMEDGYNGVQSGQLLQWYRSKLGNHIIVTSGLFTRKSSGSQQHPLFSWLTKITENDFFNEDVTGPGHKFFVKRNGELYAVLQPEVRISSKAIYKTLKLR